MFFLKYSIAGGFVPSRTLVDIQYTIYNIQYTIYNIQYTIIRCDNVLVLCVGTPWDK